MNHSANRGACMQVCRRSYTVRDKETDVELDVDNQYIMSPKDLKTIHFMNKMLDAGVRVFKIEGRARGPEYVRTVAECYKEAIRSYLDGTFTDEKIAAWDERLKTVFNRGFWDGYYLGQRLGEWTKNYGSAATERKIYVGKGIRYFSNIGVAEFLVEAAELNVGDKLRVLAEQIGVPIYSEPDSKNPVKIAENAIQEAKAKGYDVVIVDTAGRLAVDEEMMNEIAAIKKAINPNEILFVVDSMTGQDAVNTAKEFNERLDFNGVVLTKLDGDTRGGAALSIRSVVNKPIKFVGTGEKLDAIDQFHPSRMSDRILGMGDIVSLVERAQEQYDEEEAKRLQKKIAKNQFDFNDFLSQIAQIKKMGNLKDLASMIPGVGKAIKDIDIDDNAFKSIEAIIYSMTPAERSNPALLNGSRRQRIAKGSGTNIQEVNRLLKQFDQTRKMMKMVTGSKMGKMMPKMK